MEKIIGRKGNSSLKFDVQKRGQQKKISIQGCGSEVGTWYISLFTVIIIQDDVQP